MAATITRRLAVGFLAIGSIVGIVAAFAPIAAATPVPVPNGHASDHYTTTVKSTHSKKAQKDRWSARIGNGVDGALTTDRDDYLILEDSVPDSKSTLNDWLAKHPGPHTVQWIPPAWKIQQAPIR